MNNHQMLGYIPGKTPIHQLNGATKLAALIFLSVACMVTYDTRFLVAMAILALGLFQLSGIRWQQIAFVVKFIFFFSLLNILAVYLFAPEYGVEIYGSKTILYEGIGPFTLTQEQLFYELNLILKYVCTVPFVLIFLLTTHPSEFASSLHRLGVNYKISYAVALAIRYIPDVQEDFFAISYAQQARGLDISQKSSIFTRIKGTAQIVFPLILSSLGRIDTISTAMELRRFGEKKQRTWYTRRPFRPMDAVVLCIVLGLTGLSFYLFTVNQGRFYNPFR